jgi:hypothetical protein
MTHETNPERLREAILNSGVTGLPANETYTALRQRGYSRSQADLAVTRAARNGTCKLSRHEVRYDGDGFMITPVPWDEGGKRIQDEDAGLLTLTPGSMITISWSGELRTVICDRITSDGAVIRDLTEDEQLDLDREAYDEFLAAQRETP